MFLFKKNSRLLPSLPLKESRGIPQPVVSRVKPPSSRTAALLQSTNPTSTRNRPRRALASFLLSFSPLGGRRAFSCPSAGRPWRTRRSVSLKAQVLHPNTPGIPGAAQSLLFSDSVSEKSATVPRVQLCFVGGWFWRLQTSVTCSRKRGAVSESEARTQPSLSGARAARSHPRFWT